MPLAGEPPGRVDTLLINLEVLFAAVTLITY